MSREKIWIDYLADLISGRLNNTVVSINQKLRALEGRVSILEKGENEMTANEQKILDAAQTLTDAASEISEGVQALKDRIASLEGIQPEDLSQEFAALDDAIAPLKSLGDSLVPSAPGTPADGSSTGTTPVANTGNPTPDPLAGASGTTDGVPGQVEPSQPGTNVDQGVPTDTSSVPAPTGESDVPPATPTPSDNPDATTNVVDETIGDGSDEL